MLRGGAKGSLLIKQTKRSRFSMVGGLYHVQKENAMKNTNRSNIGLAHVSATRVAPRGAAVMKPSKHSRFSTAGTYLQKGDGADTFYDVNNKNEGAVGGGGAVIPKASHTTSFLRMLWSAANTALEDTGLRKCAAIMETKFLGHDEARRAADATQNLQGQKGTIAIRNNNKHSRFSEVGSHFQANSRR